MERRILSGGRYELVADQPIGAGGMGRVWVGRDIRLDREVAVKFMHFPGGQPEEALVKRFARESQITARLEHPGVPAVYDVDVAADPPFIVMQYIRGVSVADVIAEQGALPIGWAAAVAAQVCAVLAVAHGASLVHRDLKPSNLMLDPEGCVKVLDFGLAVALDRTDMSRITTTGQALGTPEYMAPEQIQASMSEPRTDLYALGATLHEMLTGRPVFTASSTYVLMDQQINTRPAPVRMLRPEVPAGLEALVLDLLEKKPEDRPASAGVAYERLLPYATGLAMLPGVLAPPSKPSPMRMYGNLLGRVFASEPVAGRAGSPATGRADRAAAGPAGAVPAGHGAPAGPAARVFSAPDSGTVGIGVRGGPAPVGSPRFGRGELERAHSEAGRLVKQSRFSQAAQVLAGVVEPAARAFGGADEAVAGLRLELGDILFEGGDYLGAAPVFHKLVADLTTRHGGDAENVLHCRLQEATCHALVGQTSRALRQLNDLLRDEQRIFGPDHARTLELLRQIGLLQLGAGQRGAAEQTLQRLRADLIRLHGPEHPSVAEVSDILARLRPVGG